MVRLLFFLSGLAGLIYEVTWVRQLGNQLGNTVHSAAIVTAVFMAGLGIGSRVAGSFADRADKRRLIGAYACAEIGIGVWALLLAFVLPSLSGLGGLVSYTTTSEGWHTETAGSYVVRAAIAVVLLVPPSFLMGATLTLLVRATVGRDVEHAGRHIGMLYGVNTAGAALGAFVTDAWLVPHLGITRTQLVAVGLNVLVGVLALGLARRADRSIEEPIEGPSAPLRGAAIALALSGFAALGMEIVWFRFLSMTLGGFRAIFSWILTVVVAGIWIGATIAGRSKRPLEAFVISQTGLALSALGLMMLFRQPAALTPASSLRAIVMVVGVPSIFMGASFPLVSAHVQNVSGEVGRRNGYLYFANTIGSVAGSIAAGLVLSPWLGSHVSFAIFAAAALVAPLALVVPAGPRKLASIAVLVGVPAAAVFGSLPSELLFRRFVPTLPPPEAILDHREGPNEVVTVADIDDSRVLMTNGHKMSGTSLISQRYMRAFAHLPLLDQENPKRALVICFGVGSTLHAASLHPLEELEVADLSRNVLEHASYFRDNNKDVLHDPRVKVFVEDGRAHLRQRSPGTYDLVTLEPPPISYAGVSALYSREFYELVRSRLVPTGMITQWFPGYDVPPEEGLAMVRAFIDVFPASALLSGFGPELILIGTNDTTLTFDLDRIERNLNRSPDVVRDLRRLRLGSFVEMIGTFVADRESLLDSTAGVVPVTDDRPSMEYTFGRAPALSPKLFGHEKEGLRRFCPTCWRGDSLDPRVAELEAYATVLHRAYASKRFLQYGLPVKIDTAGVEQVFGQSEYLRVIAKPW